jgi:hypothetical protein
MYYFFVFNDFLEVVWECERFIVEAFIRLRLLLRLYDALGRELTGDALNPSTLNFDNLLNRRE